MRTFSFTGGVLPLGIKTYIMGIVNVTPDSFSDGGRYFAPKNAIEHALEQLRDGADIIDIGAVSTRPGAKAVDDEEEWRRLLPVLKALRSETDAPLSVDVFRTSTAEKALYYGADIVNDERGVYSHKTAALIKDYQAGWIHMHGGVSIGGSGEIRAYAKGVADDVQEFFGSAALAAFADGVGISQLCFDPGFGFGKDTAQNVELLQSLGSFDTYGGALLAAMSRKRFVGEISSDGNAESRLPGTIAVNVLAVAEGADIIRVHDVKNNAKAITAADAVLRKGKEIAQ